MAGKAVAVAAKKPVAKAAKKPAAKATVKVVATKATAKKPAAAKKPAVKKPVVAKFNLNKLMMLIANDAPKKGKKMMGGYKEESIAEIKRLILEFINKNNVKIIERITDAYNATGTTQGNKDKANTTSDYIINTIDATNITKFYSFLTNITDYTFNNAILEKDTPNAMDSTNKDKRIHIVNFMRIVVLLCEIYKDYHNNVEGQITQIP